MMTRHGKREQPARAPRRRAVQGQAAIETVVVTVALVLGMWGAGVWLDSPDGGVLALWLDALREAYRDGVATLALPF